MDELVTKLIEISAEVAKQKISKDLVGLQNDLHIEDEETVSLKN